MESEKNVDKRHLDTFKAIKERIMNNYLNVCGAPKIICTLKGYFTQG